MSDLGSVPVRISAICGFGTVCSPGLQFGKRPFCLWRGRAERRPASFWQRARKPAVRSDCYRRQFTTKPGRSMPTRYRRAPDVPAGASDRGYQRQWVDFDLSASGRRCSEPVIPPETKCNGGAHVRASPRSVGLIISPFSVSIRSLAAGPDEAGAALRVVVGRLRR
jgi:hypothetical protein